MMIPPDPGSSLPAYLCSARGDAVDRVARHHLAAVLALPVSLLAARNVVPSGSLRFPVRRCLDSIRGVDTLIWALVWINVVGLGPFAGVLAIAVCAISARSANCSPRRSRLPTRSRSRASGLPAATRLHEIRFGLMPQVLPVIAGQVLYFLRIEYPVGDDHRNRRRRRHRTSACRADPGAGVAEGSFLILLILVAVSAIDWISGKLRFAIIGQRRNRHRCARC